MSWYSVSGKLYRLNCECENASSIPKQVNLAWEQSLDLWHQRLGHINEMYLTTISRSELVTGMRVPKEARLDFCEGYVEGKMHRKPFKLVGIKTPFNP